MSVSITRQSQSDVDTSSSGFHWSSNWPYFVTLAVLLLFCYWRTIERTVELLVFSQDMAHGLFAPIVAAYIAWDKRRDLLARELSPTAWAFVPLLFGALIAIAGTLGASTTFTRFASLLSLVGLFLLIGGGQILRAMAFPLALLLFTFPPPGILYGQITMPLQLLASRLAEGSFELIGYSVIRYGNILELAHQRVAVAEACSGLRSLETLFFFSLVYAYFLEPRRWLQAVVAAAALPAAIAFNVVRIVATGVLGKINPALTQGIWHELLGWTCFILSFGLVFLLHRLILRLPNLKSRHG